VTLQSSVQKSGRGGAFMEFALRGLVREPGEEKPGPSGSRAARLEELEGFLPGRAETAGMLREFQALAVGAGLKMTRFVPGKETPGELYAAWPVSLELHGSLADLGRYFNALAGSSRLWLVSKLSFRAVSPQDARSPFRASVTTRTFLLQ
jgi:Tfp pilus assembly protein PilO